MDYIDLARKALELRQFLEAENYLQKYHSSSDDKSLEYYEIKYSLSLNLESPTYHDDFSNFLTELNSQQAFSKIIEISFGHFDSKKFSTQSYIYHFWVEALYKTGKQAEAASKAREHVEFLVKKKLYHHWNIEIERYQKYFKNYVFFKVMALQLFVIIEDIKNADKKLTEVLDLLEKKYSKIDDIKNLDKSEIVTRCYELILQLEGTGIETALLSHKSYLIQKIFKEIPMIPADWKKMVELIVYETSWVNLKLAMDLSINNSDEIFNESLRLMKRKKGFNLIKLTRHDKSLKNKLISKRATIEVKADDLLTAADLKLDGNYIHQVFATFSEERDEELIEAEKEMIKRIAFQEIDESVVIDLITTFIQLEFYQVVKFIIKKSSDVQLSSTTRIKVNYLKITTYAKTGELHLALAEILELIGMNNLMLEEYIELRYMQAIIYEQIGDTENAIQSYVEVKKVSPDYRRLKERMNKFA